MNRTMRGPRAAALLIAAALLLSAMIFAAAAQAAVIVYQHESFGAFEKQLAAGEIASAEFNKVPHSLHLHLKSGTYALAIYPPTEEPQIAAKLEAKGIPVSIEKVAGKAKAKSARHHTLRYIAAGIVVLVIVVVTAVLLIDRRRKLAAGAAGPATASGDGT